MKEWYIPITILPGICLLILSTSNIMIALSTEIHLMIKEGETKAIIERKLKQLKLINRTMVFLYLSAANFVISSLLAGILEAVETMINPSAYILIIGIVFSLLGLSSLILYSARAVKIRQDQYHNMIDT